MYVDYKFWCDSETKVVTLDEEMDLNIPNGEQGWINDTPFVYHYGRGTTRADDLKSSWIKAVSEYLKK